MIGGKGMIDRTSMIYIVGFVCALLILLTLLHRYMLEKFGSGVYDEGICECCKCGMMKCSECKKLSKNCECTFKMDRYSYNVY